jgi:acyl-[acyl-carrier-protein]-phospholipid O-acyltransferase/long-chain-fatty-acid--[acyl-carrier-protein] ligase
VPEADQEAEVEAGGHEPDRRNWISFWSLMGLQAQNAFNDKALQYTLLPLGIWIAAGAGWAAYFPHVLSLLILSPFILFAPIAGWASDNFSKTRVIRLTAWMQLTVLFVVMGSFGLKELSLGVICFFFLALQSTILSPAKLGIIKELVGSKRLGFASGVMELFTILAILIGQIAISFWFTGRLDSSGDGWRAGLFPMLMVTFGAVVTLVMAYSIEVVPAQNKVLFRWPIIISHFKQLGDLFHARPLRLSALGVAYFWAFGAIVQLISIQIARELYPAGDSYFASSSAWMMLAAGGGIAVGSILAAMINKQHIELGLLPLGGIIMIISALLLTLTQPETAFFYATLAGTGFGASFFFVPVNAFLQDECDPSQRGNTLAGSNLLNCLAMFGAVLLQLLLIKLGLSWQQQFLLIGITVCAATCYVMRLLPRAFLKLLTMSTLRAIYRIETIGADRMPEKGGVLLTPNHISYLDALILTAASPRPVRFLMVSHYFKKPLVGKVAKLFDTVPISGTRAKDAIKVAAESVREGNVVCIFPEGELSRSGFMGEFKRGFELIARKADCLVQPVYLDGLWKSIFSAERGKYFWKMPRAIPFGVRVAFGEARAGQDYRARDIRRELNSLAGEVFARRRESAGKVKEFLLQQSKPGDRALLWVHGGQVCSCSWGEVLNLLDQGGDPARVAAGHPGAQQWLEDWLTLDELSEREWRGLLINAHQLMDLHNLGDGKAAVTLDASASPAVRRVWGMLLPVLTRSETVVLGPEDGPSELGVLHREKIVLRDLVGTTRMRKVLQEAQAEGHSMVLYQFGGGPQQAEDAGCGIFAAYETAGRVLSFSMPPDPIILKGDQAHPGWQENACGRLLTGFVVRSCEGGVEVSGEMLPEAIELPGWSEDERGFLSQS